MLLYDDIMCVVVTTVLTCGRSLATAMLHMLLHYLSTAIFTTVKGTSNNITSKYQSQAVLLQVLSVGGGVVGKSGVGDELRITTIVSICSYSNLTKAMGLCNFQHHLVVVLVLSPV